MRRWTILFVGCWAVLLAGLNMSCCRHNEDDSKREVIKMNCTAAGTKAVVEDKASLITQSYNGGDCIGFGVFGYKTTSGASGTSGRLFNNSEVMPESDDPATTWYYTPVKYWDSSLGISYQFAAYWPILGTTVVSGPYVTESERVLTIHNIPNWQEAGVANDFMIATRRGTYATASGTPEFASGTVNLTFEHLLSQIIINGYYIGIQENHVTVNSIVLRRGSGAEFLLPTGTTEYTCPFSGSGVAAFGTVTKGSTNHTLFNSPAGLELDEGAFKDESVAESEYVPHHICTWLTVPSTGWSNLSVDVTYTVNGVERTSTISGLTLNSGAEYPAQTLQGKTYILNLKFNTAGDGIVLETVFVKEWAVSPTTVNRPVYNW